MKLKKGFTLVELIVVITIISLLLVLIVPKIANVIDDNRNKAYYEIERRLEEAASKYILNEYVDSDTEVIMITKEELIEKNYIDEIYDLEEGSLCDAYVYASNLSGVVNFDAVVLCDSYTTEGSFVD